MYTQYPCSAPSGETVIPQSMIQAAQDAATAAIQNGVTSLQQVMRAVTTAVVGAQAQIQNQSPSVQVDPNAAPMAVKAGYSTALQGLQNQQVGNANQTWLRILQRQPGDFAGMTIPASEFNVPQLSADLLTTPMLSTGKRAPCELPGKAPQILPIHGGFAYTPAAAQLFTHPQPSVPPVLQLSTPVNFQPATAVPSPSSTPMLPPAPVTPSRPAAPGQPYASWLNNPGLAPVDQQPESCIIGGIGCKTTTAPTAAPAPGPQDWNLHMPFDQIQQIRTAEGYGIGAYRRGPFEHLRRR